MQGFQVSRGGNGPTGITSISGNLSNMSLSTLISLTAPSNQVYIYNRDATNPLYINIGAAATTGNYAIPPGQVLPYNGPAISNLQLFSNSQSINYSIFAV